MVTFAQAIQALLHRPEGERVQVIYLKLRSGKILVFLGAPVDPEEFDTVEDILIGECVPPAVIGLAACLGDGATAQ